MYNTLSFHRANFQKLGDPWIRIWNITDATGIEISIDNTDICKLLSPERPEAFGHLTEEDIKRTLTEDFGTVACCGDCGLPDCWDAKVQICRENGVVRWAVTPPGGKTSTLYFSFEEQAYDRAVAAL